MAKKATAEAVAADMRPPDFRAAVQRIRTIGAKKDKIASVNGEIADIYAKVEGHKVNRKAAKIFAALDGLEQPERDDILRSLSGLADAAGWDEESQDLVDQAEGTVVHARFGKRDTDGDDNAQNDQNDQDIDDAAAVVAGEDDGAPKDAVDDAVEGISEQVEGKKLGFREALGKSKGHLGTNDQREPYTGDNSDLAGEDEPTN